MAWMLGCNPDDPSGWPTDTINHLIRLEESEGREKLEATLMKMMTPPHHSAGFAAGRLAGLREAAEVARNFCNVGPGDVCEVEAGEWQRGIASAILALAERGEG
jgi:hypothetical protein